MVRKRRCFLLFSSFATLIVLFLLYQADPLKIIRMDLYDFFGYLVLLFIVTKYEIHIHKIPVSLAPILLIPVFLQNGPLYAALFYGGGGFLIHLIERKPISTSLYLGHLYLWSTLAAAAVYIVVGGRFDVWPLTPRDIFYTLLFVISLFVAQILLLHFYYRYIHRRSLHYTQSFRWNFLAHLISVPFGILNELIHREIGSLGILFLAIPVIALVHLFRLYYEKSWIVQRLKQLHNITIALNSGLNLRQSFAALEQGLRAILPYDFFVVFLRENEKDFSPVFSLYKGEEEEEEVLPDSGELRLLEFNLHPLEKFFHLQHPIKLNREEVKGIDGQLSKFKQILFSPLRFDGKMIGFLLVGTVEAEEFRRADLTLLEMTSGQFAIAINHVKQVGVTERRSMTDELTGLYNYRYFQKAVVEKVEEAKKMGHPLSLLIIDIDHFKEINDTFGHLSGNQALKTLADRLRETVRKGDIVARYGGEEFTILLPNASSEEALEIAERIRMNVERTRLPVEGIKEGGQVFLRITVSIGISTYPDQAEDALALIRQADRAMYVGAKRQGRNKVALYGD